MNEKNTFIVCIKNTGYTASLETRKLYRVISDERANALNMVRVVDESGEDYLYPNEFFATIRLTGELEQQLLQVA